MSRIFYDEQAEREFARDGCTVARLLTASEAAALLAELRALPRGDPAAAGNKADAGFYASFMDRDLVYKREIYRHLSAALSPRLDRFVDGYKVLTASFLDKPPGGGEVEFHSDLTMSADPDDVNINIWCPLVDIDETNGALHLIVGSQRLAPHITAPGRQTRFAACRQALKARSRAFVLRAGEAVIYESTMPHWSPPNRSGGSRFAISLLCIPEQATPALWLARTSPEGPMFELIDMSDEGYYRHDVEEFVAGTARGRSLGQIRDRNRDLSLAEFDRLMGEAVRRRAAADRPPQPGWAGRIRTLFGRPAPEPVPPE